MDRLSFELTVYALAAGLCVLSPAIVTGQHQKTVPESTTLEVPRMADGRPDLQGVWDFRSLTPLERPSHLGDQDVFTEEEAAEFSEERLATLDKDQPGPDGRIPLSGGYNDFWWDYGRQLTTDRRTSLLIDPPTGRIPARSPEARSRTEIRRAQLARDAHGPEDRGAFERCILGFNAGPPMNPSAYNNNMQLFQTTDHIVILNEMVHDARVISLDGTDHLPSHVRQWRGDSRGQWNGDVLVVKTNNFTAKTSFRGSSDNMLLVERFSRVAEDTLLYEYTVHDADSFARSWTVSVPMRKNKQPIFEYACHEGNYGMTNLLVSARVNDDGTPQTDSQ